jgi:hypothetical protein
MNLMSGLCRDERTLKAVFGLGREKFEELAEGMQRLWQRRLENRPGRQRAVGAGQHGEIPTGRHKLAFVLFYLKVYPTYDVMSVFSGINRGESCRWVHKLMPLLEELLGHNLMLPKRKIDSMEAFIAAFPQAVEVIIDGMERPIQRPKKNGQPQALLGQEEKAHAQGDRHGGAQPAHRLPDAGQTGCEARPAAL